MTLNYSVRIINPNEKHIPIEWAREEGWNPGLHDAYCHYPVDPDGWFCAVCDDEIIGVAVATNYDSKFSFGGFYIVHDSYRDLGIGWGLVHAINSHVGNRNFGIDGVFNMQDKYSDRMGMKYAYRNIRWQGIAYGKEQPDLVPVNDISFDNILLYDTAHFPAVRREFLERWIRQPDGFALAKIGPNEELTGYGVIRRCFEGYKIGPLFANSGEYADEIYEGLTAMVPGETVFFDTPEPNAQAVDIARTHEMHEVFGTARMYSREIPNLPLKEIFGVTTFELG